MRQHLAAALAAACLCLPPLASAAQPAAATATTAPLKIGYLYATPVTRAGWARQHDTARLAVQQAFGARVRTTMVEDVPESADAERVLRDLIQQGQRLIFSTSFGYARPVLKVAAEHPEVKFECLACAQGAANVAAASTRDYEGRYLAGVAAGRASRTQVAGYVASLPTPEVLQGINAFTLGLRSVQPKATVRVVWLGEWFNPAHEREAANTLIDQGADVLAFHTGSTAVMLAAQERGKLAVAYPADLRAIAPDAQLLAVTHHWEEYEKQRVQALLDGRWQTGRLWGGLREGMVAAGDFGPRVPAAVRQEVLARQQDLAAGRLQPFAGPLRDTQGTLRVAAGQHASDAEIEAMDYLVQGVEGGLPH